MKRVVAVTILALAAVAPAVALAESAKAKKLGAIGSNLSLSTIRDVEVMTVEVSGGFDEKTARVVVESQVGALGRCFEKRRKVSPGLFGDMDLRLLVEKGGKVVSATIEDSTLEDDDVERCARREAMDLRFASWTRKGHLTVRYSLRFQPLGLGALMGTQIGQSFGYGGLELKGVGGSGGAAKSGSGKQPNIFKLTAPKSTGPGPSLPAVTTGTPAVRGSLSKEVIRRYIRRNINQIRFCYEQQLARHPNLMGRISVRFMISPSGNVSTASVAGSTMGNADVERCVARAISRMTFPQPQGGGVVIVTYPFMFRNTQGKAP